ncbi:hypothetical protein HGP17_20320 [Rhizobium sp. P38BS-XIX]|uniref:hypothetical protein n=1 Tax=Rhizobium sp. P38BS-XIX TaxID=2726740 RepID=UPI001456AF92|nr:hypothetical protein [Rhizobium sp. P38BS-XIX]NLR99172.1 hypothetical protein [Rhizobium sp. P38BS-XIX]
MSKFPWAVRAKDVEEARKAINASPRTHELVERFQSAVEAAYPPGFWEHYDRLKGGDARGVEMAIEFLEADPWFFRSGYIKANLARFLKRVPLSKRQVRRLESVLLKIVDERNTEEFRNYCRLARVIVTPTLQDALTERLTDENFGRVLRARWMLSCIGEKFMLQKSPRVSQQKPES